MRDKWTRATQSCGGAGRPLSWEQGAERWAGGACGAPLGIGRGGSTTVQAASPEAASTRRQISTRSVRHARRPFLAAQYDNNGRHLIPAQCAAGTIECKWPYKVNQKVAWISA